MVEKEGFDSFKNNKLLFLLLKTLLM